MTRTRAQVDKDYDALTPLKEILDALRKGWFEERRDEGKMWEAWDAVVQEPLRPYCRVAAIKKGTLKVTVSDSMAMQELRYLEGDLREGLNRMLGKTVVKAIRFKMGS